MFQIPPICPTCSLTYCLSNSCLTFINMETCPCMLSELAHSMLSQEHVSGQSGLAEHLSCIWWKDHTRPNKGLV